MIDPEIQQMRRCSKCTTEKPLEDFPRCKTRSLGRSYVCKACRGRETRTPAWREQNRIKSNIRYERSRQLMQEMKSRPCTDCGGTFPHYVMEWDHPDRKTKSGTISRMAAGGVTPRLLAEIAKCQLVCANCHRVRTRRQFEAKEYRAGRPRFEESA